MNIVYLSHSSLPSQQANLVHVLNMCSSLSKKNNLYLYVWSRMKKNEFLIETKKTFMKFGIIANFKILNYPNFSPFLNSFIVSIYLYFSIQKKKIDFVIGRNLRGCFFLSLLNIPIVYESHKQYEYYNLIDRFFLRKLIKKNNFVGLITISNYLKNSYQTNFNFKNNRLIMLRDGSNIDYDFNVKPNGDIFKIGYIGSFQEGRGIELIIQLADQLKNMEFHLVGGNKHQVYNYKNKFKKKNLTFYGHLDYIQSLRLMRTFDILVAPYQINTYVPDGLRTTAWMSPLKLFEYMAAKKPIITSNLKSIKEFMKHNYNCLIVESDNLQEWVNAILNLYNNKILRKNISLNAYNDLKNNYTWEKRSNYILKLYKEFVEKN